jgi:CRISPR/Cas system-associated exonuclease Cas4 (RecB family)
MRKVYYQIKFPKLVYFPQELRERGLKAELRAKEELKHLKLTRGRKIKIRFQEFSIICLPDYIDWRKRLVVEVKSVQNVRNLAKTWIGQINLYMLALSYEKGILVQVDDSGILDISEFYFDENMAQECIAYFERLNEFIKNDKLPELPDVPCSGYCSFSKICGNP